MKLFLGITALLFVGSVSFAAPRHPGAHCGHEAWMAANPSAAQNTEAHKNMKAVKDMYDAAKAEIDSAIASLKAAFEAHPIVQADVEAAGMDVHSLVAPIQHAGLTAMINTINLLSSDQRILFNDAYKACEATHPAPVEKTGDWSAIDFASGF